MHISQIWTQKLYLTQYQTRNVPPFLNILKKQQKKYSNVFPVTAYQQALKLHPRCAYKETYKHLIKKDKQPSLHYLATYKMHNHMAQVAQAVVDLSKVSSPEQFTFVLQLAVRPIIQLKIPPHLSAPTELKFDKEILTPEEITEKFLHIYQHQQNSNLIKKDLPQKKSQKKNCCNLILPQPFHPKLSGIAFKHPTRCLAAAAHFLIRKKLFNSKYPQLLVAKDFAVAEKKLHLAVSGRKYHPGKKAPKKRHTSDVKTADLKPSTSQDQPQDESISKQQPQGTSTTEQQPQGKAATDTQQEPVPPQFSDDDELTDAFATTTKTFEMKDPRSAPKKPKYSLRPKILHI